MNPFGFNSGSYTMTQSETTQQPTLHWRALANFLEEMVNFEFFLFI